MSRPAPQAIDPAETPTPPAALAWARLGGPPPASIELLRRARSKPAILRLRFSRPRRPAIYAKWSPTSDLSLERLLYEQILPRLPVTVPRYRGSLRDDDGGTWLFIESAGERWFSDADPEQRALASRWLGLLHRSAADASAGTGLPDIGPARYLSYLRTGRDGILRHFGNPWLTAGDREVLTSLLERLDVLEAMWPRVQRACQGLPATLVHGDLRPKNVRVRFARGVPTLYVLDWEMAGWGIPAADLACAGSRDGPTVPIDAAAYRDIVRERWPDLGAAETSRLAILGRLFQGIAGTAWAASSLRFESPLYLLKPVQSMAVYRRELSRALEAGAEWLG